MEGEWHHKLQTLFRKARTSRNFSLLYKISGQDSCWLNWIWLLISIPGPTYCGWNEICTAKRWLLETKPIIMGRRKALCLEKVKWMDILIDFHYISIQILTFPIISYRPRVCHKILLTQFTFLSKEDNFKS